MEQEERDSLNMHIANTVGAPCRAYSSNETSHLGYDKEDSAGRGTGDIFFIFPHEIRKIIYTTNAIESLHMSLRKII